MRFEFLEDDMGEFNRNIILVLGLDDQPQGQIHIEDGGFLYKTITDEYSRLEETDLMKIANLLRLLNK